MTSREVSQHPRPSDVETLLAAGEMHTKECQTCQSEQLCLIGARLSAALAVAAEDEPAAAAETA